MDATYAFWIKCAVFPNSPAVRWEYRVHEQILPSVTRSGGEVRWTDIVIDHTGYQDHLLRRAKLERNLKLLLLEQEERPNDAFTLFNLGRTYRNLDHIPKSMEFFRRSLELAEPTMSIVRKLHALLASGYMALGQVDDAVAICVKGLAQFPNDAELLYQNAILMREKGDLAAAEKCLIELLQSKATTYFDLIEDGVRGYKARHQLALVYQESGRRAEAVREWQRVAMERPDFAPAKSKLRELSPALVHPQSGGPRSC